MVLLGVQDFLVNLTDSRFRLATRGGVLVAVPGYGYRLEQGSPQPA